ncbi:hypothetical protein [Hymenobacter glacialis]|uniref:GIY-YIG domain-containing protein n=1 Tax=Hymenobacter glacialis TaxID=1908236 RepID=A0A1G1T677_9BACT|nr:hypothetical protein [Hymenobacter glacialis]OGX86385.1 hypothetical protein BEN48_12950 [Hymenobacter glacialis]
MNDTTIHEEALETVVLSWKGPYTFAELQQIDEGNGVYLLTGTKKYSHSQLISSEVLYCGITQQKFRVRINQKHQKLPKIKSAHLRIWLGCLLYPAAHTRRHLELLETCLISFWQPELNEKKRANNPKTPICLVVKWCKQDGTAYKRFPQDISNLQDVIWWDCNDWRVGDLKLVKMV